jgi:hypothetical protein
MTSAAFFASRSPYETIEYWIGVICDIEIDHELIRLKSAPTLDNKDTAYDFYYRNPSLGLFIKFECELITGNFSVTHMFLDAGFGNNRCSSNRITCSKKIADKFSPIFNEFYVIWKLKHG